MQMSMIYDSRSYFIHLCDARSTASYAIRVITDMGHAAFSIRSQNDTEMLQKRLPPVSFAFERLFPDPAHAAPLSRFAAAANALDAIFAQSHMAVLEGEAANALLCEEDVLAGKHEV